MSEKVVEIINYCPGVKPQLSVRCQTSLRHFSWPQGMLTWYFVIINIKVSHTLLQLSCWRLLQYTIVSGINSPWTSFLHFSWPQRISTWYFVKIQLEFQVVTINKLLTFPTINHLSSINPDQREYQLDIFCNYKYS